MTLVLVALPVPTAFCGNISPPFPTIIDGTFCNGERSSRPHSEEVWRIPGYPQKCLEYGLQAFKWRTHIGVGFAEAEGVFKTLLRLYPTQSYGRIGYLALKLRRYELGVSTVSPQEMLEEGKRLREMSPQLPELFSAIAKLELIELCVSCSKATIAEARKKWPGNSDLLMAESDISIRLRDYKSAVQHLHDAIYLASTPEAKASGYFQLAQVYRDAHDFKLAEESYITAQRHLPGNEFLRLKLAEFYLFSNGDAKNAESILQTIQDPMYGVTSRNLRSLANIFRVTNEDPKQISKAFQTSTLLPNEAFLLAVQSSALNSLTVTILNNSIINKNVRDEQGNNAVLLACRNNNRQLLPILLKQGVDPNAANSRGETALMHCVASGQREVVSFLLDSGVDINSVDTAGNCALALSVHAVSPDITKMLLAKITKSPSNCRFTVEDLLVVAAVNNDLETARIFLDHGVSVNAFDKYGFSPLIAAVQARHIETVEFLLSKGADPRAKSNGRSALDIAKSQGDERLISIIQSAIKDSL